MEALAPVFAVSLLRFDRSAPPSRSRNVIGSRMAGARRAADMAGWREARDLSGGWARSGHYVRGARGVTVLVEKQWLTRMRSKTQQLNRSA